MARLAYTMAPHQVALDQRKLLLLLLALFFSCCLHKPMQLNGESRYLLTLVVSLFSEKASTWS